MKYKNELEILDKLTERLKAELYIYHYKSRKRSAIDARHILSDIKKLCHALRHELNEDIRNRPVVKMNISKEKLEEAKRKRAETIARKAKNGKGKHN